MPILENINPYDQKTWQSHFIQTDLYKKISEDFDYIDFSHFIENSTLGYSRLEVDYHFKLTPRQRQGTSSFSGTIFYYLNYLLEDNPTIIHDLGCGWNIFKKYIPEIYGYDTSDFSNKRCLVDEKFFSENKGKFKHVMSINALHYKSLDSIKKIVENFSSLLENNGIGLLTLNTARMTRLHDFNHIETFIRSELYEYKDMFRVFDVNLSLKDAYMDGNVRLIIQK